MVKKTAFKTAFGPAQREAFVRAKRALTSTPVLKYPHFAREFIVHTEASEAGVGAFLAQTSREGSSDSDLDIIAYYSHRFSKSQRHYSATMKECCAVVWAVTHQRPYLRGKHFTCCTDLHAHTYLYKTQDTSKYAGPIGYRPSELRFHCQTCPRQIKRRA